jgi:hypothetical protein
MSKAYMTAYRYNTLKMNGLIFLTPEELRSPTATGTLNGVAVKVVSNKKRMPEGVDLIITDDDFKGELDEKFPDLREYFND